MASPQPSSPAAARVTTPSGLVVGIPEGSRLVFGRGPDADLTIAAGRGLSRRAGVISAMAAGAWIANISRTHALYTEGDGYRIRLPRLDGRATVAALEKANIDLSAQLSIAEKRAAGKPALAAAESAELKKLRADLTAARTVGSRERDQRHRVPLPRQRPSGTSHSTPSGGSVTCAECGWSCHEQSSASMPP